MAEKQTPPKGARLLAVAGQEDNFILYNYLVKQFVDDGWHNFQDFDRVLSNGNVATGTDGKKWLVANGIKNDDVVFTGYVFYTDRDVTWYDVPTEYIAPPDVPTSLRAFTMSEARIGVSWSSPEGTSVQIERATQEKGPFAKTNSSTTNSLEDRNLEPSTKYYYRVRAINDGGTSEYSETVSATSGPYKAGGGTVDVAIPLPTSTLAPTVVTQYLPTPVATTPASTTMQNPTKSWLENNLTVVLIGGGLLVMVIMAVVITRD